MTSVTLQAQIPFEKVREPLFKLYIYNYIVSSAVYTLCTALSSWWVNNFLICESDTLGDLCAEASFEGFLCFHSMQQITFRYMTFFNLATFLVFSE